MKNKSEAELLKEKVLKGKKKNLKMLKDAHKKLKTFLKGIKA